MKLYLGSIAALTHACLAFARRRRRVPEVSWERVAAAAGWSPRVSVAGERTR